jgi:hypothetical protein
MIQLPGGGWVTRPPERCANGHPWAPASGTYRESWFSCWCDGAQDDDDRPGHTEYVCKTCGAVTLVPTCTDPTAKTGWAASHGH